jgi:hypothetical protein
LISFSEAGEITEFKVLIRPIVAPQAPGQETGNREPDRAPAIGPAEAGRGRSRLIAAPF